MNPEDATDADLSPSSSDAAHLAQARLAAEKFATDFVSAAIEYAIKGGFQPDPALSLDENAVAMLREGLPMAAGDDRFSSLMG